MHSADPHEISAQRAGSATIARRLTILYITALLIIGLLASTKFATTSMVVQSQEMFAEVINSAGRQRMKSQRLLVLMQEYLSQGKADSRVAVEIDDLLQRMAAAHTRLMAIDLPRVPMVRPTGEIQRLYNAPPYGLDRLVRGFIEDARVLLDNPNAGLDTPEWRRLRDTGLGPVLEGLDRAVQLYEDEAERNLQAVTRIELSIWALTLLVLLVEALVIFRPMVSFVRQNAQESERVEGELLSRSAMQSQTIAEEKTRSAAILYTVGEAIITINEDGYIETVNRACEAMFGWSSADLVGRDIAVLMAPQHAERHDGYIRRYLMTGDARMIGIGRAVEGRRKDGTIFPLELSVNSTQLADRRIFTGVLRDLTFRRAAEAREVALRDQLQRADKLRTVGTLAGGIAHDFNNVLTPILGYTDLLLASLPEESQVRADVEVIHRAARRAREIVSQMLAFSRPGTEETGPVSVIAVMDETARLLRNVIPPTVTLMIAPVEAGLTIIGNPGRLQQVLVNLIKNAMDALDGCSDGRIQVAACIAPGDMPPGLQVNVADDRAYACITVEDNGPGMSAAVRSRVFEPFFTTKPVGRGTGLGLSVAYGIITGWGGDIVVQSEPRQGTVFKIFLPLASEVQAPEPEATKVAFRGHALVVDDDPDVRAVAARMLGQFGMTVSVAAGVDEALELLRKAKPVPDLLLTDQSMPGRPVAELVAATHARLGIRIVLMSGFDLSDPGAHGAADAFVQKPLSLERLAAALEKAGLVSSATF